jgi:uncharacterized protein
MTGEIAPTQAEFLSETPVSLRARMPERSEDEASIVAKNFILKIESRCNLACDYCYMYEMPDQSWRDQPKTMSDETIRQTGARIGEYAKKHDIPRVSVVFHGGEPLLADRRDPSYFGRTTDVLSEAIGREKVSYHMQTNGTLITEEVLGRMAAAHIMVGVSLDGEQTTHDAHRTYKNGRGSFSEAERGIKLLAEWEQRHEDRVQGGLLSVINVDADPMATYNTLTRPDFRPRSIDFLLPLAHHSMLPPGYNGERSSTPYADWLITIYDYWAEHDASKTPVRLFDEIHNLIMGHPSYVEYIGPSLPANLVIETNGQLQQVDTLKSVQPGGPSLGLNVFEHTIDEAMQHPKTRERLQGAKALAPECLDCQLVDVCSGGYQPHRWQDDLALEGGGSFRNPSVYCQDLTKLITHIAMRLDADQQRVIDSRQTTIHKP